MGLAGLTRGLKTQAIRCPIRSRHSSRQSAPRLKSCGLEMQSRSSACSSGKKRKKNVRIKQLFRKLQTTSVINLAIQTNLGPSILKAPVSWWLLNSLAQLEHELECSEGSRACEQYCIPVTHTATGTFMGVKKNQ